MSPRPRTQRPTLPPEDEEKLAETSSDLATAVAETKRQTRRMDRIAADIGSGGIVLEPLDDEDSLVAHIEECLAAHGGQ